MAASVVAAASVVGDSGSESDPSSSPSPSLSSCQTTRWPAPPVAALLTALRAMAMSAASSMAPMCSAGCETWRSEGAAAARRPARRRHPVWRGAHAGILS